MGELRKKSILPILGLVLVAILVVSLASYAYWQITKKQTDKNIVGSACLDISLSGSNDINLANAWPISDEEGAETTPYTFIITNNCDTPVNYQVALESLSAGANEPSNYLDYNYLRVKLDNDVTKTYGGLPTVDDDEEYEIRDTKKIVNHTLLPHKTSSHDLRIWIYEDTPLQEEDESYNTEKYFYGKVKVIAGQNVEGDTLKLMLPDDDPIVTLSNISIGDRVKYGTEEFYVVGIDGNNIRLLSRYKLNVGSYTRGDAPEGLQSAFLAGTRTNAMDESTIGNYSDSLGYYYGGCYFSDNNYWWDSENGVYKEPYLSSNKFVYSDQAVISQYVNEYVETLQKMGLNARSGTLLKLEDLSLLCNREIDSVGDYNDCPYYLFETTYWLGTLYFSDYIYYVVSNGSLYYAYYGGNGTKSSYGVRPVITVSLNQ